MYWLLLVFITLVAVFWFTSKDRSPTAMIESIVSDFRSKGPDPFDIEGFRGHGHRGIHEATWGRGWWPWYKSPAGFAYPVDPIPYPFGYEPLGI